MKKPSDRTRLRLAAAARQYGYNEGCIVPGCTRPARLHHMVPRREGGTNAIANLIPNCAHHENFIHIAGGYARKHLGGRPYGVKVMAVKPRRELYGCMDCGFNYEKRPPYCPTCKVEGSKMGFSRVS